MASVVTISNDELLVLAIGGLGSAIATEVGSRFSPLVQTFLGGAGFAAGLQLAAPSPVLDWGQIAKDGIYAMPGVYLAHLLSRNMSYGQIGRLAATAALASISHQVVSGMMTKSSDKGGGSEE